MIIRMYGTCNGNPVVFKRAENYWVTVVPRYQSGEYFVSLIAEDEAGNKGHFVDVVLAYNLYGLKVEWVEPKYKEVFIDQRYTEVLFPKWKPINKVSPKYRIRRVDGLKEVFILGEERYVSFDVVATRSDEEFTILKASWELLLNGELESSGDCRIDNHTVSALICPQKKYNSYDLLFTYLVGNETLKAIIQVEVMDTK